MKGPILGWDVGGANVKVARLAAAGDRCDVLEASFELWREPERLPQVLSELASRAGNTSTMAVTMTAELADCFATKREGVGFVLHAFQTAFPGTELFVYGVDGVFRSPQAARSLPDVIAAANWMASATLVATTVRDTIFLDVGSTTTDIVPIVAGRVAANGRTDSERLSAGELVYTGALRTPVCAIVQAVPLRGLRCRVAAEVFAVSADVHVWLGHMSPDDYTCGTPDGRGRSRAEAGVRLARMVCADSETIGDGDVTAIAEHVGRTQVRQIGRAIRQVRRNLGHDAPSLAVVCGSGSFIARAAALSAHLTPCELSEVMGFAGDAAKVAPAAAVAHLLAQVSGR